VDQLLLFALVGLGAGAAYAALALGLVVTYKGIGVINFAAGAMGMWSAYVYDELAKTGDVVLPVVIVPHRLHVVDQPPVAVGLAVAAASAAALGLIVHLLVFRPLRTAPALAKVVASAGVMLTLQALVVLHFGSAARRVAPILPTEKITVAGQPVARDRLILAGIVAAAGALLWAYFRFTRTGLATRAAAENERSASLARYSPQRLAGITWVLSSVVVGVVFTLAAPTLGLNPATFVLLIVPALACALLGRLTSIAVVVVAGLLLGALQSEITFYSTKTWWPEWARTGFGDAVPFLVVVVGLFIVGRSLPSRGAIAADPLPAVVLPRNRPQVIIPLVAVGIVLLVVTDGAYRFGVITSMIFAIIALSLVLLTGLLGQISFAQAALAGSAGFALSKLTTDAGVPFPLSILLSTLVAVVIGVVVGLPALRIRGAQLAVVTLALAVALERFLFRNPDFTSVGGNPIEPPRLFGVDLGVRAGSDIARVQFGLVVLALLVASAVLAGNVARSATGRRFLAVRSNERAGAAIGINVAAVKLTGFALSAAFAGLGGSLIGYSRGQLSAESFTVLVGVSFVAFAYLGGITSISGALFAGFTAPLGLSYVVATRLFHELADIYLLLTGISLVLTAILNPVGVAGAIRGHWLRHRPHRRPPDPATDVEPGVAAPPERSAPHPDGAEAAPAGPPVLEVSDLSVHYGGVQALDQVSLTVNPGQIVGLIGPNGAGKTTLIDALTGFTPYRGGIRFDGEPIDALAAHERSRRGLVRTWQSMELFGDLSVLDNLRVAVEPTTFRSVLLDLVHPSRPFTGSSVEEALALVGLGPSAQLSPGELSLGQQKLVGVARAIAANPKLVLLDEPAAGLASGESRTLGEQLRRIAARGPGLLLVDHDMGLVLDVCDAVYVVEFGRVIAAGSPQAVRSDPRVIEAYLGTASPPAPADAGLDTRLVP
jgi:ABC-type branched-subunit amino acid transport system ATPase component/branched-subunit amino acid ABC-type transport system permease component